MWTSPPELPNDPALLRRQLLALQQERDTLSVERDTLSVERDTLSAERDTLSAERDTLSVERDTLSAKHDALLFRHEALAAEAGQLREQARLLQEQLRILRAHRFGRSSEKGFPDHPSLFDEAELEAAVHPQVDEDPVHEDAGRVQVAGHERQRPKRKPLPPELPRIEVIHDLPESEKVCGLDGHSLVEIGREASEQLDVVPQKVQVLRHVRIKYGCPHCRQGVQLAPLPPQPIPKALASAGTLAWLAVAKYADGLPLYRLEKQFQRMGVEVPRATLAHWIIRGGVLIQPLINLMNDRMLDHGVIQMDETPVHVLKEDGRKASSKSYMWVRRGGPPNARVILFDYDPSRSGDVPKELLEGYKGWLQTDGYTGYLAVAALPDIEHVGCWAHARRKFVEAVKAGGKTAKANVAVALIGKLYAIEKEIRGQPAEVRQEARQREAPPILEKLREWMLDLSPLATPSSALGKALGYLREQWPRLVRYIDDGRLEIDNNGAENAIRPFVVGRKNWLFSDTVKGVKASANFYSLIETAKANGLEPYACLRHLFERLPSAGTVDDFDALLPWNLNPDMTPKVKPSG